MPVLDEFLTVRSSGGATIGVVTKGVDVETTLRVGVVSFNLVGDRGRAGFGTLLKSNNALHGTLTSENSNCTIQPKLAYIYFQIARTNVLHIANQGHQGTMTIQVV